MARRAFYSFHYVADNWRAAKIRNIGVIEGNGTISDNDWEEVKKKGDRSISNWIDKQMFGRSCTIVLIGENTAGRKWIDYEIINSWNSGMGVLGIHIHRISDRLGFPSAKGANPFKNIEVGGKEMSKIVKVYDPPHMESSAVYNYIAANLEKWVEDAIAIRNRYYK
ncbi:TIR domain-containing protein [Gorillibacterium sp. sgz5001074]|uniref:TIR domain-containing protein n=1 Tax=Gorillibacterium sp. sgz5001074 TaxID=3446695 RepID=UPI003F6687ED